MKNTLLRMLSGVLLSALLVCSYTAFACSMKDILGYEQEIDTTKRVLELYDFNYIYLGQQELETKNLSKILTSCQRENNQRLQETQVLLKKYDQLGLDTSASSKIFSKINDYRLLERQIQVAIVKNESLLMELEEELGISKEVGGEEKHRTVIDVLNAPHAFQFNIHLKSLTQIFKHVIILYHNDLKAILYIAATTLLACVFGLISSFKIGQYIRKKRDFSQKFFLHYLKILLPLYLPITVANFTYGHYANNLLYPPVIYLTLNFIFMMLSTYLSLLFYLCYLTKINSKKYIDGAYSLLNRSVGFFAFYWAFKTVLLVVFQINDFVMLIFFLVLLTSYTYYFIKLGCLWVNWIFDEEFRPSIPKYLLNTYRHIGLTLVWSFGIFRLIIGFYGYVAFSAVQVIWGFVILLYFFKFLELQKVLFKYLSEQHNVLYYLKHYLGIHKGEHPFEFSLILGLLNGYIFIMVLSWIFKIITLPAYYISLYDRLIFESIKISSFQFSLPHLAEGLLFFAMMMLLGRFAAEKCINSTHTDIQYGKYVTHKILIRYFFFAVGLLIALAIIGLNVSQLSIVFGSLGLGAGIGLQSIIENFVSGLLLLTKNHIHIGDFINVISHDAGGKLVAGKVEKITSMDTQILSPEQELISIPNAMMLKNCVTNFSASEVLADTYINFNIKNIEQYPEIVSIIDSVLTAHPEVADNEIYQPIIKLVQPKKKDKKDHILSINFKINDVSNKTWSFHRIKKDLLQALDGYLEETED